MSHTVSPLVNISLLASVRYKESLVWFKISGFCYTINNESSLWLLLNILLLPCVIEILQFQCCISSPFTYSSRLRWCGFRWGGGQLIALVLGLGELCSIAPTSSPYEARNKGWDRFSGIHSFGTGSFTSPQAHSTVITQTRCRGRYPKYCSLWGTGTALPLLCPQGQLFHRPQVMRVRGASSPCPLPNVADEGHIQVSRGHVLRLTHSCTHQQGQLDCTTHVRLWSCFPSASTNNGEAQHPLLLGEAQHPLLPQVVRSKGGIFPSHSPPRGGWEGGVISPLLTFSPLY